MTEQRAHLGRVRVRVRVRVRARSRVRVRGSDGVRASTGLGLAKRRASNLVIGLGLVA